MKIIKKFVSLALHLACDSEVNSTNNGDTCKTKIADYTFYPYVLIPAILITTTFAFSEKRKSFLLSLFSGRPGMIYPMDPFTRYARISYACAFGATANLVGTIVTERNYIIPYNGNPSAGAFLALLSVFVYGMAFFPIFGCLAVGSVFGYGLGIAYIWMLTGVEIFKLTECEEDMSQTIHVFAGLPSVLCLLYLSGSVFKRVVEAARKRRFFLWNSIIETRETLTDIRNSFYGKHTTSLFRKPVIEERKKFEGRLKTVKEFLYNWFMRTVYHRKEGFRYPSRMLSVMIVAVIVVYQLTLKIAHLWTRFRMCLVEDRLLESVIAHINLIADCGIVSIVFAFIITAVNILHMMSDFRSKLLALYKGDYHNIRGAMTKHNSVHCRDNIKYSGFQVAYIVWGFLIQVLVLFLVIFFLAWIMRFHPKIFARWMENLWPWLIVFITLMIAQRLLAKFFFLQERGKYLALDNRRCFFVFSYFMFFYNMFVGLVMCLLRILTNVALGILFVGRLDRSTMPRTFEFLDPGYNAYLGYMLMEYTHSHPLVIVFTRLLQLHLRNLALSLGAAKKDGFMNLEYVSVSEITEMKNARNRKIRLRWHVLYTLLRNPSIRSTSKHLTTDRQDDLSGQQHTSLEMSGTNLEVQI